MLTDPEAFFRKNQYRLICIDELSKMDSVSLTSHWVRGGFPESLLADSDEKSKVWREDFIRTSIFNHVWMEFRSKYKL